MSKFNNLVWLILTLGIACSPVENTADIGQDFNSDTRDMVDLNTTTISLIDQQLWNQTPFGEDPFSLPANPVCDPSTGIGTESLDGEPTIAILTDFCPWATVEQPSLIDLKMGDEVSFRIWHFELTGEGPAHIKIQIGDWLAVDEEVEKPHKAQLISETLKVPRNFEIGSKVYFHVDNHGANEYSLVELSKN